jgi:hypothetical protein
MEVRNIFSNFAGGMSDVSLDWNTYVLMSDASRIKKNNEYLKAGEVAGVSELQVIETRKNKRGETFDVFIIDGVEILHRYNGSKADKKHSFFMNTVKANEMYKPYVAKGNVVDTDFDSTLIVDGFVTTPVVA